MKPCKKFTEQEIEMLQEMIDFPMVYKLSDKGISTINSILEKVKSINNEEYGDNL